MSKADEIGLAFLQQHPRDAARVFESLPTGSVAALLAEAPSRLCGPVLREMQPAQAARCLEPLEDERAARHLRELPVPSAAAILRQWPEPRQAALLEHLPTARALLLRALLAYPRDTVGAWSDPQALAVPIELSVAETLARVRAQDSVCDGRVFVTGSERRLLGEVALGTLLRAAPEAALDGLISPCAHTLPARAPLRSVGQHPGWDDYRALPVLERGGRFNGTLDRRSLRRAQLGAALPGDGGFGDPGEAVSSLGAGYWNLTAGLLESLVELLPADGPAPSGRKGPP